MTQLNRLPVSRLNERMSGTLVAAYMQGVFELAEKMLGTVRASAPAGTAKTALVKARFAATAHNFLTWGCARDGVLDGPFRQVRERRTPTAKTLLAEGARICAPWAALEELS